MTQLDKMVRLLDSKLAYTYIYYIYNEDAPSLGGLEASESPELQNTQFGCQELSMHVKYGKDSAHYVNTP
jgi:hypothetical protein